MILLELDPNVVKPGWTPLLITIGIALVMVLLFRSMRRQFRRVDDNFPEPAAPVGLGSDAPAADEAPVDESLADEAAVTDDRPPADEVGTAPPRRDGRTRSV